MCHTKLENENHLMFKCNQYLLRINIFVDTQNINILGLISVLNKWKSVMCEDNIVLTAKYVQEIFIS